MKHIIRLSVVALTLIIAMPALSLAQKEKKEKKEKKEWKWEMPSKMTNIPEFDKYLRTCDELSKRINTYTDSVTFYTVKKIQVTDGQGRLLKNAAGEDSTIIAVVDAQNNIRGSGEAFQQYARFTATGMEILSDLMEITTQTVAATTSLASKPMVALSHGKYLKAGPKIVSQGGRMVKELMKRMKEQKKAIRAYKQNYTESGVLQDPTIDPSTIEGGIFADLEVIQKPEDAVGKELADALAKDAQIGDLPDGEDIDIDSL